MRLLKRTYALPPTTLEKFEKKVSAAHRSAIIAELLLEWLDRQQRERLRREVIEGCREMAEVYLEFEREFHPLEEEVQRALDAMPGPGRDRPRPARPRRRLRASG